MNQNMENAPESEDAAPQLNITSKSNHLQVFCRLRPLQDDVQSTSVKLLSPTTLSVTSETKIGKKQCNYVFSHVFTSYAGQRELFEHVAAPLLEDLFRGKNGLLFTYGVTGSGKTYTLTGDGKMPGIMPRCINTIFNSIGEYQAQKYLIKSDKMNGFEAQSEEDALEDRLLEMKSTNKRLKAGKKLDTIIYENDGTKLFNVNENNVYSVFISYTEIYNNTVYDLLDESAGKVLQAKIIREDSHKNMYINGVLEIEVKSATDAFELFYIGQKRKRMAHTILNAESSRSHSTFNIRIVQMERNEGQKTLKVAQLSLVDLAGSERCSRTHNTGAKLKEASSINNSLMSLRTCLQVLIENQLHGGNKLVPYRDSRLTLLFKNYFEGDGQVRMIVCVNPCNEDSEENLQVLKFAEMTQEVKVAARVESRYTPYRKPPSRIERTPLSVKNPTIAKAKRPLPFSFAPKLPNINLDIENPSDNDALFDDLLKTLHLRKQKREADKKEFAKKERAFRARLIQMNQENMVANCEMRCMKAMISQQKQANRKANAKIVDIENANENLHSNNEHLQEVIQTLQNTVAEKNLRLNQNHLEREKSKQRLVSHNEKMSRELEEKLRLQRQRLEGAMLAKEAKIQKVKDILESDVISVSSDEPLQEVPQQKAPEQEAVQVQQIITVATPKTVRHRRSRSIGDVWLEHNSVKPVPLSTVLQPAMKKRKSVSKLQKAGDITNPKQNKYCLIAQDADATGDVETKLYKGDIVPTCGGGAQVIFNDVECLTQQSPTAPGRN